MKKITFDILDLFLLCIYSLEPELNDDTILFKQKDKRVFKYAVSKLIDLLYKKQRKPFFLSGYMKKLSTILIETNAIEIIRKIEKYNNEMQTGNKEPVKSKIKKSDFIKSYVNNFWKQWIVYQWIPEEQFLKSISFLEYEELIGCFREKQLGERSNFISALVVAISSAFSKEGLEQEKKNIEEEKKKIEEITFDRQAYQNKIVGGGK